MNTKEITDLHIHSTFSYDSKSPAEDYVIAAVARGDKRIGFSEHYDYDCKLCGKAENAPLCDLESYKNEVNRLREKYEEHIKILFGIEFGYDKRATEVYGELSEKYKFDYAINSVHLYNGTDFYLLQSSLEPDRADYVYRRYLDMVRESLSANYPWQIVGHIGYPKRYTPFKGNTGGYSDYEKEYSEIIDALIKSGKYLELNTSTKGVEEFLPDKDFVLKFISAGGKNFTFGSDAHSVDRYKNGENQIKNFLSENKITACYLKNRMPTV